jgi:hypothetical protein
MLLDHIAIYGWDEIETLILAAALSNLSILFIGDIGSNKTEGSKAIAKALLRPSIEFRNYEVPTLNFDDLVGFVSPKNLAKGTLEFIPTPLCIWNADAVLFDEINRAELIVSRFPGSGYGNWMDLTRNSPLLGAWDELRIRKDPYYRRSVAKPT